MTSPTTVSLLTARGRSAIAVVAIEGAGAAEAIDQFFRPAFGGGLADRKIGRVIYGDWQRPGDDRSAEGVVVRRSASDRWEVHSHGGTAAIEAIIDDLTTAGCRRVSWIEETTTRSTDPLAAAATVALSHATTARTAGHLLAQHRGALRLALTTIKRQLTENDHESARKGLQTLIDHSRWGLHLTAPWKVVLCGSPNVGKSSLINALLGYGRSIVYDRPGTTRDVLTATTAIDGWPVELSDTAGIRASSDELETAGIAQARKALLSADLAIPVVAASTPLTDGDLELVAQHGSRMVVVNKCDLPSQIDEARLLSDDRRLVETSAATGQGIADLLDAIASALLPKAPEIDTPTLFTADQIAVVRQAVEYIDRKDLARANELIMRLTTTGK